VGKSGKWKMESAKRERRGRRPFPLSIFHFPLFLLLLPACVSERITPRRGVPVPSESGSVARQAPAPAPAGPIASPAGDARTLSSRVVVAIKPLGAIPYDGLCIPLVSPDGRHVAVQTGPAPPWSAILARPEPEVGPVAVSAGLAVYRLMDGGLELVGQLGPEAGGEGGLLLGRSADDRGFLVESPRPDGSRWIGRVGWQTGELTWLVQTPEVNAHAVLTAAGDLLYTRSPDGTAPAVLVCRTAAGVETTWAPATTADPSLGVAFPITGADPAVAAVFVVPSGQRRGWGGREGLRVVGLRLEPDGRGGRRPVATSSARVAAPATVAGAYQAAVPAQAPIPRGALGEMGEMAGLLLFETERSGGVMSLLDAVTGELTHLPAGSIAAVPVRDATAAGGEGGLLVAGPRGLLYVPGTGGARGPNPTRPDRALSVVAGAYLPRATRDPGRIVLFGAAEGGGETAGGGRGGFVYEVSVMLLGPDTGQPPAGPS